MAKVTLSFYRDDDKGSAFERHARRLTWQKHNSVDIVCKHFTGVMGIKQEAVKFGLGAFDLKLFR